VMSVIICFAHTKSIFTIAKSVILRFVRVAGWSDYTKTKMEREKFAAIAMQT